MQDVSDKYILLEETEKQALRKALIEERQRFCCFVAMLRPIVVSAAGERKEKWALGNHSERATEKCINSTGSMLFTSHTLDRKRLTFFFFNTLNCKLFFFFTLNTEM